MNPGGWQVVVSLALSEHSAETFSTSRVADCCPAHFSISPSVPRALANAAGVSPRTSAAPFALPAGPRVVAGGSFFRVALVSMAKIFARGGWLNPVNRSYGFMRQREFPWLSVMPAPKDAAPNILSMCQSEQDAFSATLCAKGRQFTASWFAQRLGVSAAYLSQLRKGAKPIPGWIIEPLCCLSGTNLLRQYRDLQDALRLVRSERTERERQARIAAELLRAAA